MIHGGAGAIREPAQYEGSLRAVIETGVRLLEAGASALDAVAHCVALLEDDPLFNAGRGSVLNAAGDIFMDASIMDGRDLSAGAVAGVRGVRNPVRLARAVMEKSGHVLLIGAGAEAFAASQGLAVEEPDYFRTETRLAQLMRAQARASVALDHAADMEGKLGTVGAVARDLAGNLAVATSTGGVTNQAVGRVGDSPIIGAGTYADNQSAAISCTGRGEDFIRTTLARVAAFNVEAHGMAAPEAARAAIDHLARKTQGQGGLIIVDRAGRCARAHSTPGMLIASAQDGAIMVEAG